MADSREYMLTFVNLGYVNVCAPSLLFKKSKGKGNDRGKAT